VASDTHSLAGLETGLRQGLSSVKESGLVGQMSWTHGTAYYTSALVLQKPAACAMCHLMIGGNKNKKGVAVRTP